MERLNELAMKRILLLFTCYNTALEFQDTLKSISMLLMRKYLNYSLYMSLCNVKVIELCEILKQ